GLRREGRTPGQELELLRNVDLVRAVVPGNAQHEVVAAISVEVDPPHRNRMLRISRAQTPARDGVSRIIRIRVRDVGAAEACRTTRAVIQPYVDLPGGAAGAQIEGHQIG